VQIGLAPCAQLGRATDVLMGMMLLAVVIALLAPGAALNQWQPGDLCRAGARGGIHGALSPDRDDLRPRPPIRFDMECQRDPLAKGCM
jgi:hypothetical protein